MQNLDFGGFLTQDIGHTHGWNLMNFLHVKDSELAYVHAENQCIWMVFGGQINSIYWFSWISVQYFGLKKTREIWLADFCHFLEKYTSEFNKNWDLAINSYLAPFLFLKNISISKKSRFFLFFEALLTLFVVVILTKVAKISFWKSAAS